MESAFVFPTGCLPQRAARNRSSSTEISSRASERSSQVSHRVATIRHPKYPNKMNQLYGWGSMGIIVIKIVNNNNNSQFYTTIFWSMGQFANGKYISIDGTTAINTYFVNLWSSLMYRMWSHTPALEGLLRLAQVLKHWLQHGRKRIWQPRLLWKQPRYITLTWVELTCSFQFLLCES